MTTTLDKPLDDLDLEDDFDLPCEVMRVIDLLLFVKEVSCTDKAVWVGTFLCQHGDPQSVLACDPCKKKVENMGARTGQGNVTHVTWTPL